MKIVKTKKKKPLLCPSVQRAFGDKFIKSCYNSLFAQMTDMNLFEEYLNK